MLILSGLLLSEMKGKWTILDFLFRFPWFLASLSSWSILAGIRFQRWFRLIRWGASVDQGCLLLWRVWAFRWGRCSRRWAVRWRHAFWSFEHQNQGSALSSGPIYFWSYLFFWARLLCLRDACYRYAQTCRLRFPSPGFWAEVLLCFFVKSYFPKRVDQFSFPTDFAAKSFLLHTWARHFSVLALISVSFSPFQSSASQFCAPARTASSPILPETPWIWFVIFQL